jgi:hypothetical protein
VADRVEFTGFLDERGKHEQLAAAWLSVCPSVKEGWGMVVIEAGGHGVPTVGYHSSGGLQESVVHGTTGLLVDDLDQMTEAVARLLEDDDARRTMGAAAVEHAAGFEWAASVREFAGVLARSVHQSYRRRTRVDAADLAARLERIQAGGGIVAPDLDVPMEVLAITTASSREPASSGLS